MTSEGTKPTSGWKRLLFGTTPSFSNVLLRLTLAGVIYPHGAQKVLGLYGGYGWTATMKYFTDYIQVPAVLGGLVMLIEFLAPFALVLGFCTRPAALGVIAVMVGAIMKVHLSNGFFMNWTNDPQRMEGYEYHLLVIAMALVLVISGAGCFSIDRKIGGADAAA
jgi:putative oxidoreductase